MEWKGERRGKERERNTKYQREKHTLLGCLMPHIEPATEVGDLEQELNHDPLVRRPTL